MSTLPELDYESAYRNKNRWHLRVSRFLRQVAPLLPGGRETDVRSNRGGSAILGEVILHTDQVYVQVCLIGAERVCGFFRTVTSRKDYTGGLNQWMRADWLHLLPSEFAARILFALERTPC